MNTSDLRAMMEQVERLLAEEELSERAEVAVRMLLNAVERLSADIRSLAEQVARLRNQLEQKKKSKTTLKPGDNDSSGNGQQPKSDHSSEARRKAFRNQEVFRAGLASTTYQQTDDTSARVQGQFWHTSSAIRSIRSMRHGERKELLTVLNESAVPLHNNASELGARVSARRRDVSLHSRSQRGVRAVDIFTTLVQTAKKLGTSAYAYLRNRLDGTLPISTLHQSIILSAASG